MSKSSSDSPADNSHPLIFIAVVGVIFVSAVVFLFDSNQILNTLDYPRNARAILSLPNDISEAQTKWLSKNVKDYDINVKFSETKDCIITDTTINVRDGKVISAYQHSFGPTQWPDPGRSVALDKPNNPCLSRLTPPGIYAFLRQYQNLDPQKTRVEVQFDPEFGYVTDFSIINYGADLVIGDFGTLLNFHPLAPGSP